MGNNPLPPPTGGLKVNAIKFSLVVYFLASVGRDLTWRSVIPRQLVHNVKAQKLQIEMFALINRDSNQRVSVPLFDPFAHIFTFFQLELALIDIET